MRNLVRLVSVLTLVAAITPDPARAQIELRTPEVRAQVGGRVQLQFSTTSVSGQPASEFLIRRARLSFTVTLNDWISGRIQPEFGLSSAKVRDAWIRMDFGRRLRLTFGQFKVPFDLFGLTSSTQTLVIERTGVVAGAGSCPGIIFCSYSAFSALLFLSDRDVGVMVDGTAGRFYYGASVTNGNGQGRRDNNGTKSYTGRVAVEVANDVSVGLNASLHDFVNDTAMASEYAPVVGADLEVGNFTQGFHVQFGAILGENWRNVNSSGNTSTFFTTQGILSYKFPIARNNRIEAIEPLGRVSWGDADTDLSASSSAWLFTPGVQVFFTGRNKISLNVDIYKQDERDTQWSLKSQVYFYF